MKLVRNSDFYSKVLKIIIPVAVQQAINMGVNMLDTIMLGSFGEVQLSASSLANSFYSFYNILCMGVIGGCSVLVSQYWGAQNLKRARETFSLAFRLAAVVGFIFAVFTWLFPSQIMMMFTTDAAVIEAGDRYLRITAFIYMIHGTSLVTSFLMRSVGKPQLGLYVSIVSFVVNIFANWVFIFGKFGAPRMEIAGAALGTLIARIAEWFVTFFYVLIIDKSLYFRMKDLLSNPSRELMSRYRTMGMPAFVSDGMLGIGNTVMSMVLGRMGAAVVASNAICQVMDRLVTVVIAGVSNAASIITGNTIGEGKTKEAFEQGETFYFLGTFFGMINGLIMLFAGPLTLKLYKLQPDTIQITREMLIAYAGMTVFSAVQSVMTKGVLRGGGDTKFLMIADILFLWVVSLPLGYLVGVVLHGPGWLAIICLRIDHVIKAVWCLSRLKSRKWIRNVNILE